MNRYYAASVLASAVAVVLGACGGDDSGAYYYSDALAYCAQFRTCGQCTPIRGCGWCFNSHGGICTTDPNECAVQVSEFTWTWDPSGCPDLDASVAPLDAGAHPHEASAPDAPDAQDAPAGEH
jgi:hypothetical protein